MIIGSPYLEWVRAQTSIKYPLGVSGMTNYLMDDFPAKLQDIELSLTSGYRHTLLLQALANFCHVDMDCVTYTQGASMGNYLAMAAVLQPGDEVVIEHPVYDPLLCIPQYLGATIKRFHRRVENNFALDLAEIKKVISPRTRLIVMTNLHNPSSAFTDNDTLAELGSIARSVQAHVLIDGVYLETLFEKKPPSAFHMGPEFITVSSLTKAYGLSGLRCGWVLAQPEIIKKIGRLYDLFGGLHAHPAECLSVVAFDHVDLIAARAKRILSENRLAINAFLDTHPQLRTARSPYGITLFPQLVDLSVDTLYTQLRTQYDTLIIPGHFFEMPTHFRLGLGIPPDLFKAGLANLDVALGEI